MARALNESLEILIGERVRKFVVVMPTTKVINFVVNLPLSYYTGYVRPHAYDLSNQAFGKWLGDALNEAGRHAEAEEAFRHELDKHPYNGWSLFGLERALRAQGRDAEADEVHEAFRLAWARSDTYIRSPIF